MTAPLAFRTVFLSDTHLGMTGVRNETLLSFLRAVQCETLYLVGDMIDGWALQRNWQWSATDDAILKEIFRISHSATRVVYIPGNHDDMVRDVLHVEEFEGIELRLNDTFDLADGRKFYVSHGDQFDAVTNNMVWLSKFGHVLYEGYTSIMRQVARVPGLGWCRNLPAQAKSLSKRIFQPQGAFERGLRREAGEVGAVGAIAGHIHRPALNTKDGFTYANCGDWVESCTALVEDETGRLSLLYWSDDGLVDQKGVCRLMHILLVSDAWHPQINGVVRTLDTTREIVESKGHTFSRITPDLFEINMPMPMYKEIGLALFWPGAVSRRIKKIIKEKGKIDAIHVATEGPLGMAARSFCQRNKIPFTTSFHTKLAEYINERTGIPARWLWRWLEWFHRPAQRVLVTNQGMADELAEFGIKHTHLWPRGVDLELFHPSKAPSEHVQKLERPVFAYVGRVAVEKNIESFLKLDLPGSKMIVGSGPSYETFKAKYTDAHFTGPLHGDELAAAYADSDVFVFPSKTDTFGLVLLEACAAGTPVAAYPVTGPKDVITDPNVGTLSEDLHEACLKSLTLSSEAARTYAEKFSWDAATETFIDALERTSVTGNEA